MRYVSTRGATPALDFEEVTLAGLASDGGLYVPEAWPSFTRDEIAALAGLDYVETAVRVLTPFVGDSIDQAGLRSLCRQAYGRFAHAAVTPLVQLDQRNWLLELFHGPTLAFKDVALQLVGRLYDHVLKQRGTRVTIVGALDARAPWWLARLRRLLSPAVADDDNIPEFDDRREK